MANTTIVLEGEPRTEFGKGPSRRMRAARQIPATIYAGGDQPVYVKLPMKETTLALRHTNALITVKYGEDSKIVIRNIRRDANDAAKKLKKDSVITEDELKKSEDSIQKLTDARIKEIDNLCAAKEKDILEI